MLTLGHLVFRYSFLYSLILADGVGL